MSDETYEQNFYRTDAGNLMCSGCKTEVFGGACHCNMLNRGQPQLTVVSQPAYSLLAKEENNGRSAYDSQGFLKA